VVEPNNLVIIPAGTPHWNWNEGTGDIGLEHHSVGPNSLVVLPAGMPHRNWNASAEVEYHLNLRVPEPDSDDVEWDIPVTFGQ